MVCGSIIIRRVIVDGAVDTMMTYLALDSHLLVFWVLQQPVWKMVLVVVRIFLVSVPDDCIVSHCIGVFIFIKLENEELGIVIAEININNLAWAERATSVPLPPPILNRHTKAIQ